MAMRRGHHTSRVLKALGTPDRNETHQLTFIGKDGAGDSDDLPDVDEKEED